ncbi:MAG: aspartate kinase [Pirellulales bacterium]|nr:aspartate kinase [Pirellulales bacterium]
MSIIVQKFGGTSVADSKKILAAARKAIRAKMDGHQVVTVVSAMGQNTDVLIDLAKQITDNPPPREMDMLLATGEQVSVALMAMAIHSLGHEAISLTGAQIGIITDSTHTKARIHSISTDRIHKYLDRGNIVIAAGFQGIDDAFNITTLGRGGSDTTAVALAAVLGAVSCEIYTDVDGVYTTDPRIMPEARRVAQISYDEMLELASAGAAVMHNRSIEFAKNFSVPVHVRSSFSDVPGTMIVHEPEAPNMAVCGAALSKDEARVTIRGVPDHPGTAHAIFSRIAAKNIPIDMIVQSEGAQGMADMSFSVSRDDLGHIMQVMEEAKKELNAEAVTFDDDVAKVSVVGLGMATQTGVAGAMFTALAEKGINIEMITTSEIKISVLVAREHAVEALRTVHGAFQLSVPPRDCMKHGEGSQAAPMKLDTPTLLRRLEKVAQLERLEKLIIDEIALDETQAMITFVGLADIPGLAAQTFDELAEAGIVVDMIVQSIGRENRADISVTVKRAELEKSLAVAKEIAKSLSCPMPTYAAKVAKLSVFGTGIKSHSGVASRMFRALSESRINLELISTSEVRINVVVDGACGARALAALKKEFADSLVSGNGE